MRVPFLNPYKVGSLRWAEAQADHFDGRAKEWEDSPTFRALRDATAVTRPGLIGPVKPAIIGVRTDDRPARPVFEETALGDTGRLEPVADFDDSAHFCTSVDDSPQVQFIEEAEKLYRKLCDDECGIVVDRELLAQKAKEKAALRAQSHAIARKLELAKVTAYRSSEWTLWVYGVHSGEVEEMPQFRRISFIPFVGAQIREPFVRELEYYLQSNPWARFWTLTGGRRVLLCEARRAARTLSRRIRKLNDQPFMHEAGVRIVFRSIEFGSVERSRRKKKSGKGVDLLDEKGELAGAIERDAQGRVWLHPHAHCLVELEKGRLPPAEWSAFLKRLRAYWKDWMDDAGVIRSAREAVKYVTKPGEIQHLSPAETAALFEQLRRLKIVQPLGSLAADIKRREEAGLTLVRERTDDGFVWRAVKNWNRGAAKVDRQKHRVCVRLQGDDFIGPEFAELSQRDMRAAARMRTEADKADVDACVVVARCTPSAASNGVKEPRVVVMGKRFDLSRVMNHPLVDRIFRATYDQWQAGLALIRVHTGTPSVPISPPSRRRGPSSRAWTRHFERLKASPALS